uniref:MFS domain-containing protein n=1 Tax=Heterorhabditis bacteriophora TaxID=37862 RepID=A0A1I7WIW1_HETBA
MATGNSLLLPIASAVGDDLPAVVDDESRTNTNLMSSLLNVYIVVISYLKTSIINILLLDLIIMFNLPGVMFSTHAACDRYEASLFGGRPVRMSRTLFGFSLWEARIKFNPYRVMIVLLYYFCATGVIHTNGASGLISSSVVINDTSGGRPAGRSLSVVRILDAVTALVFGVK